MFAAFRCRPFPAALGIALALIACDSATAPAGYPVPPQVGDGWTTGSPEIVGMAIEPLVDLAATIDGTPSRIHAFLVVRHNTLVFERYWPGTDLVPGSLTPIDREFDRNTLHYVASVSKSLTSALLGIAMARTGSGRVEDPMLSFFPEHADLAVGERADITLEHLLSFSSGLEWNEFVYDFSDPRDSHNQMFAAGDPVLHLLTRPMTYSPGDHFHYNSGDTNLVGEIVRRLTGAATLADYAAANLFGPLGIDAFAWLRFGNAPAVTFASGGASLRPRDMARFGQLYLDRGVWNGTQLVPAEWVDASTVQTVPVLDGGALYGYGYNWWLGRSTFRGRNVDFYCALGWGGQYVFVYPELDLVVVHTAGGYYDDRPLGAHTLIREHVLAAITD